MAISLKNIEDRVKVLEGRCKIVKLTSFVFLNRTWKNICDVSNYDILFIYADHGYSGASYHPRGTSANLHAICVKSLFTDWYNQLVWWGSDTEYTQLRLSGNYLQGYSIQSNADPTDNKVLVYGLKLYYNFSYNIIYKILSSIKFKISQIISSPKTTRR